MERLKSFFLTSILGGLTVLLPGAIILIVFSWIFDKVAGLIEPLTHLLLQALGDGPFARFIAQASIIVCIALLCFLTGLIQKTRLGQMLFNQLERTLGKLPGYVMVKETIQQFTERKKSPFSSVVLVRPFDSEDVWMTGFVTDQHHNQNGDEKNMVTVFCPTGPNPTTGAIMHLPSSRIKRVHVSVESAMRSIISCGSGSKEIVKSLLSE